MGYKLSSDHFLASYTLHEDGYVLGVKGDYKKYYPLPQADTVALLQAKELLPRPFPVYALTFDDYLFGYLLWIILPFACLAAWLQYLWQKRNRRKGWIDPEVQAAKVFMDQYLQHPLKLPLTLKGKSWIPGANDLVITDSGFAFTVSTGKNDITYWADVSGFSLMEMSSVPFVAWNYSQEFRSLTTEQVIRQTTGISQKVPCKGFEKSPVEITAMLNATWLRLRAKPVAPIVLPQ